MKHKNDDIFCILHRELLKKHKGSVYDAIIAWNYEYDAISDYLQNYNNDELVLATASYKKMRKKMTDFEEYELVYIKGSWIQRKYSSQYWSIIQEEQDVFNAAIGLCDMILSNDDCNREETKTLKRAMEIFREYRDAYQEVDLDTLERQQELTDEWKRHVEDEKA